MRRGQCQCHPHALRAAPYWTQIGGKSRFPSPERQAPKYFCFSQNSVHLRFANANFDLRTSFIKEIQIQ